MAVKRTYGFVRLGMQSPVLCHRLSTQILMQNMAGDLSRGSLSSAVRSSTVWGEKEGTLCLGHWVTITRKPLGREGTEWSPRAVSGPTGTSKGTDCHFTGEWASISLLALLPEPTLEAETGAPNRVLYPGAQMLPGLQGTRIMDWESRGLDVTLFSSTYYSYNLGRLKQPL